MNKLLDTSSESGDWLEQIAWNADGDGRITQDEMSAPAQRLQRTPGAAATPGMMGGQMPPAGN